MTIQLSRRTVAIALAVFLAVAGLAAASFVRTLAPAGANHRFPDVATGTFFHESSGAIFDAGCADGFGDGTFRPNIAATRGQFGYWTHNCASRAAYNSGDASFTDPNSADASFGPEVTLTSVTLQVGNTTSPQETQFVSLIGNITSFTNSAFSGVCQAEVRIYEGGTLLKKSMSRMSGLQPAENTTANVVVPATTGPHTYTLKVAGFGFGGTGCVGTATTGSGLSAVTSTFGSTGGNTLSSDGGAAPRADDASLPAPPAD